MNWFVITTTQEHRHGNSIEVYLPYKTTETREEVQKRIAEFADETVANVCLYRQYYTSHDTGGVPPKYPSAPLRLSETIAIQPKDVVAANSTVATPENIKILTVDEWFAGV